jgi:hypothetical protein
VNAEVKEKWLAALRSGEIPQIKAVLAQVDGPGRCCLGVLCDLAVAEGVIPEPVKVRHASGVERLAYGYSATTVLPYRVMRWAGVPAAHPLVQTPDGKEEGLAVLNDSGYTFAEIADLIEASL